MLYYLSHQGSCNEMVGGAQSDSIKSHTLQVGTLQMGEQRQRSSHTVMKALSPTSGCPSRGLAVPRESELEVQRDWIAGFPRDWGKQRLHTCRTQAKPCVHQEPGERSSVVMAVFYLINFCLYLLSNCPDLSVALGRRTHPRCFTEHSHSSHGGLWLPVRISCLQGTMFSVAALPSGLFVVLRIVQSWAVAFP